MQTSKNQPILSAPAHTPHCAQAKTLFVLTIINMAAAKGETVFVPCAGEDCLHHACVHNALMGFVHDKPPHSAARAMVGGIHAPVLPKFGQVSLPDKVVSFQVLLNLDALSHNTVSSIQSYAHSQPAGTPIIQFTTNGEAVRQVLALHHNKEVRKFARGEAQFLPLSVGIETFHLDPWPRCSVRTVVKQRTCTFSNMQPAGSHPGVCEPGVIMLQGVGGPPPCRPPVPLVSIHPAADLHSSTGITVFHSGHLLRDKRVRVWGNLRESDIRKELAEALHLGRPDHAMVSIEDEGLSDSLFRALVIRACSDKKHRADRGAELGQPIQIPGDDKHKRYVRLPAEEAKRLVDDVCGFGVRKHYLDLDTLNVSVFPTNESFRPHLKWTPPSNPYMMGDVVLQFNGYVIDNKDCDQKRLQEEAEAKAAADLAEQAARAAAEAEEAAKAKESGGDGEEKAAGDGDDEQGNEPLPISFFVASS